MSAQLQPGEPFFTTPRLHARRFATGDVDAFIALRCNPEVARFQDWESFTQAERRAFGEGNLQPMDQGQPRPTRTIVDLLGDLFDGGQ